VTDCRQIVALYDRLVRIHPSPVVKLNRAVAIAMRDGPEAGLAHIERSSAFRAFRSERAESSGFVSGDFTPKIKAS
jgi:RNA polymerase sigma-70 factor (ECF subfamily)